MTADATIALRLGAVDQLIDLHDGAPLRPEAADYLMRHARRLPRNGPIRISVSLPGGPASAEASRIAPAIAAHCTEGVAAEDKVMAEPMADSTRATLLGLLVHERLPIARRRALYRRLATAECRIGATA